MFYFVLKDFEFNMYLSDNFNGRTNEYYMTSNVDDARKFNSYEDAKKFLLNNLSPLGWNIVEVNK